MPELDEVSGGSSSAFNEAETPDSADPRNNKLPEDLQLQLRGLCKKFSTRELKDRRWEIKRVRKARFFWRGIQHLLWNADAQALVGPSGAQASSTGGDQPTFMRDFNIYTPYGKAFCSTFCQNQPATRFEPDDPKEAIDLKTAAASNRFKRIFEKWNPPKQLQLELARLFWTDDRVVAWTRYEVDGQRFGYNKTEGSQEPRGREITTLHGVLEHKCPITIKDQHDFIYQKISVDLDTATVKGKFQHISEKIQEGSQGTMDDAFARNARIATGEGTALISESGDALSHLSTIDYFWLRPDAFETLDEMYRDELQSLFPDGVRVAFVGDVYAESIPVSMDDELTVFHATAGDGQNRNGLGDWVIPVQEVFNNLMNMSQEYYEYGIPEEWCASEIFDIDAENERRAQPGGRQTFNRPKGEAADDLFHQSPTAEPPESMMLFMQYLQGAFCQFVSGQQAAVFGKSDQHNETAKGIALLRDQAMGLVGLVWMPFTLGWANVVHQAVKCAAANRPGGSISTLVPIPGKKGATEPIDVDVDDLRGNVVCSPETDENFPESWTEKSNKVMQIFSEAEKNPSLQAIAMLPANQQLYKTATGLDDLTIPGQASNEKQLSEIDDLLVTGPTVDKQTGQTTSTIPIDVNFDDHEAEWQAGKTWVNDPEAGQKAAKSNPDGFANVKLHLLLHKAQVDQAQAQQQAQAMQMKNPTPPQDPQAQAAKAELLRDAASAVQQLDALSKVSPMATAGNITGQVTAANDLLNAAIKASQQ